MAIVVKKPTKKQIAEAVEKMKSMREKMKDLRVKGKDRK